jgi:hypothetical protein
MINIDTINYETYKRIDGLVNINAMGEFLNTAAFIINDVLADEPFERQDVVRYLKERLEDLMDD